MWRKNRKDNGGILGCKGVDLNRNWAFHFNGQLHICHVGVHLFFVHFFIYKQILLLLNDIEKQEHKSVQKIYSLLDNVLN